MAWYEMSKCARRFYDTDHYLKQVKESCEYSSDIPVKTTPNKKVNLRLCNYDPNGSECDIMLLKF